MSDLLRLTGVTVPRPGDRPLVALDLAMPAGRVDVVLGANGAGKSEGGSAATCYRYTATICSAERTFRCSKS